MLINNHELIYQVIICAFYGMKRKVREIKLSQVEKRNPKSLKNDKKHKNINISMVKDEFRYLGHVLSSDCRDYKDV